MAELAAILVGLVVLVALAAAGIAQPRPGPSGRDHAGLPPVLGRRRETREC